MITIGNLDSLEFTFVFLQKSTLHVFMLKKLYLLLKNIHPWMETKKSRIFVQILE